MTDNITTIPADPWLIDVHQHFVPDYYRTALSDAGVNPHAIPPWVHWDVQSAIDSMDRMMIRKGIVSITDPGVNFGDDAAARTLARQVNETAAELAQLHPNRFGGFASLPIPDVDGSLKEIEYSLDTLGLDGVVLMSSQHDGSYVGDPKYYPVMDELNRRKAVVFVHPAAPIFAREMTLDIPVAAGEFVFDTSRAILNLVWSGTAHRCPDIKFVFSHAGGTLPFFSWRAASVIDNIPRREEFFPLGAMEYFKRFNYDLALSAAPYAVAAIRELVPSSQLFFGSDLPFAPDPMPERTKQLFDTSEFFTTQERLQIGISNPEKLLAKD